MEAEEVVLGGKGGGEEEEVEEGVSKRREAGDSPKPPAPNPSAPNPSALAAGARFLPHVTCAQPLEEKKENPLSLPAASSRVTVLCVSAWWARSGGGEEEERDLINQWARSGWLMRSLLQLLAAATGTEEPPHH